MVVLRVEESYYSIKGGPLQIQEGGDDVTIIFGINKLGVFGEGIR
jgi:hypothetical protein